MNLRTVSMPGFDVSPARTFHSVPKGTPDSVASDCICAWPSASSMALTCSALGMSEAIVAHPTVYGTACVPFSVDCYNYARGMAGSSTKRTLWANVQALMHQHWQRENLTRLARETRIGNASAARLKASETSVGVDILEKIAAHFGVEPWQLLAQGLGSNLYVIKDGRVIPVRVDPPPDPDNTKARLKEIVGNARREDAEGVRFVATKNTAPRRRRPPSTPRKKGNE